MDRMGTIPISSATKSARRGSARSRTKLPVGPLKRTGSPTLSPRSHWAPMPPGVTSTASVITPTRVGGEEQHGLGHVLGQDGAGENIALSVELLEVADRDPLRPRPLAANVVGPE